MRLIDADKLMDIVEQQGYVTVDDIINATTVEAEPVKHGRWVRYVDSWRKCSLCGSSWNEQWGTGKALNYCPSCGAKMDGGAENAAT